MEKIQEITDKIYREGVEKGNAARDQIISSAQEEARKITEGAAADAGRIIEDAKKRVAEMERQSQSSIRLCAERELERLKHEIRTAVVQELAEAASAEAASDSGLMCALLMRELEAAEGTDAGALLVRAGAGLLPLFRKRASHLLARGLRVELMADGRGVGFEIVNGSGGYTVRFGEEELREYFGAVCGGLFRGKAGEEES